MRLCHYKTCSTFNSSPEIGSIGRALKIGRALFANATVPVVVGVPDLGRYQVFLDERETAAHLEELAAAGLTTMDSCRSVVIYSAAGPDDRAVEAFSHRLRMQGMDASQGNERLGAALGRLAARLLSAHPCRLVVAGGDTWGGW